MPEITPLHDQTPPNEATKDEIQEGWKGDHLIKICATDGQERFKDLNKSSTKSCTIFKANVVLHESNSDAYKPKLISIGPYHKKNPQLRSMENYKLRYLQQFLQRKLGIDVESCIREMEKLKDEALKCYDDIGDLDPDIVGKFSEMLLLDGCFIVEYMREVFQIKREAEDKIVNAEWMVSLIDRDLLLLENQLPFFVLTKLHDMTKLDPEESLLKMVKYNFCGSLPRVTPKYLSQTHCNVKGIKHLLHVVHTCVASHQLSRQRSHFVTFESEWTLKAKDSEIWHDLVRSATELDEAGVKFSKVGDIYRMLDKDNMGDSTSLFDINFDAGLMKIPCFEVVTGTETMLRNLVAYEQHSSDVYHKYFTDYVVLMDRLINSEKDVKLLRLKGIIRNRIGDDNEVAVIFNKLGEGVIPSTQFYYKETCKKVVKHCDKRWNRWMANLRHNYFNGPWVGLSTAAAVFLLVLTLMQTVLTFVSTL
ncbi:putative UPF0481 protein At3g02645 [Lycium ferocissimum]|uniref:putative UPF0481 protein At3g02645 n=1 Tax=Lycium ferocissimum TaxID=112874 RepID=UPI0028160660|nr:putative UPF0481 protein At3g02645 [Lycium ferocissimum]